MRTHRLILCSISLLVATSAAAQTQRTGDNAARAMQQVQQLSAERTQLKADNEKLKREVESLKKQAASATSGEAGLKQRAQAAEAAAARDAEASRQSAESLEKTRGQLQELLTRYREMAQSLKEIESDRNEARGQLRQRDRELKSALENNLALYDLNRETLDRLEKKGVWSSLTEKEPITKIQRNRLENLIDGYRERAAELKLDTMPAKP